MSYTRQQVVRYCLVTAAVTLVGGLAFGEFAYRPLRRAIVARINPPEPEGPARPRAADLRDTSTMRLAREKTESLFAMRQANLSPEKHRELMSLWHELRIWQNLFYLGIRIQKNPMDLFMMQQVIGEVRPDYIIEAGTAYGGSALYWAHILDGLGLDSSKVITIDIEDYKVQAARQPLWKQYVEFLLGSSTDSAIVERIRQRVAGKKVLVVLDSNHEGHHVLAELRAYGPMVSQGSYIVVEDTNLDGLPLPVELSHLEGPGPMSAVVQYLAAEGAALFTQDLTRENFVLTFNSGGWLRRK